MSLSQVYGFVKQSGGHIKIYSELGIGTTFKIYLPRRTGDQALGQPPSVEAPVTANRETILVVEDDDSVRRISVTLLQDLGYTVLEAASAEAALVILATPNSVDLLFTDVVMPGITGRALADRVADSQPAMKVLFTTGYTRNAVVRNGVLDENIAFITKPFTADQLASKVRQVLAGQGANRLGMAMPSAGKHADGIAPVPRW